jgi:hypothetical protein
MKNNTPTKPTLDTCARLFMAAETAHEQLMMLKLCSKHGYSSSQIRDFVANEAKKTLCNAINPTSQPNENIFRRETIPV